MAAVRRLGNFGDGLRGRLSKGTIKDIAMLDFYHRLAKVMLQARITSLDTIWIRNITSRYLQVHFNHGALEGTSRRGDYKR